MTTVTFVIPVRHPDNSSDWSRLKANLAQTIQSIGAQTHDDWRGIIVANRGSDLPAMPQRFAVEHVDFAPNLNHDLEGGPTAKMVDAVRLEKGRVEAFRMDKGRRVLKGMLKSRDSRFFMIVDDDDFVSARITQYAADHADANGWRIDTGYVWDDGGRILYRHSAFNNICGSSLIIRSDLYQLPATFDDAQPEYIKEMLGSHRYIAAALAARGTPLASLPFPGAIYRVGHSGSWSQTPPVLKKYILNRQTVRRPYRFVTNLARLRLLDGAARREFFGTRTIA